MNILHSKTQAKKMRSMIAAGALVAVGIVAGVVLVSAMGNSYGVETIFAKGDHANVALGGAPPQISNAQDIKSLNTLFTSVSKAVLPTVVSIHVVEKAVAENEDNGGDNSQPFNFFFHWFGPNGKEMPPFHNQPPERAVGEGSGVIVTNDGYILTNNHVVEDASEVKVYTYDRREYLAKVIGTDPGTDLAVVKIDAHDLRPAAFGNSDALEIGEWVEAVGNPLNLNSTVTAGIISAKARPLPDLINASKSKVPITDFLQTDAAINPGNSGGGLFDMNGMLVGINSAIATTNGYYQGYGFAIPVNIAKVVAEDLIAHGKVERGYIGVRISQVNDALADASHLGATRGVAVNDAQEGGAGAKAGLQTGDIILSVDGHDVNSPSELQGVIAEHHVGDKIALQVWRDGKQIDVPVTLGPFPGSSVVASNDEDNGGSDENQDVTSAKLDNLGISVKNIDDETKSDLDVKYGVIVTDVNPYSDAASQGLAPKDVIMKADAKKVTSSSELEKIVKGKKIGDTIVLVAKGKVGGDVVSKLIALRLMKQVAGD